MGTERFDVDPMTIDSLNCDDGGKYLVAVGFIDGDLQLLSATTSQQNDSNIQFQSMWSKSHKTSIRKTRFSASQKKLYCITSGKSVVELDPEKGKKTRVKIKCHEAAPFSMKTFERGNFAGVITGDEDGAVRIWDFRAKDMLVAEYEEHEDYVADINVCEDGKTILTASADSTLGAYDFRAKKSLVQSEPLNTELLSLDFCSTNEGHRYFACGTGSGHVALFKDGEYGNLLERVDAKHKETVDCVRSLHVNEKWKYLVTGSNDDGHIKLIHIHPHRTMATIGHHEDGTEELSLLIGSKWVLSVGHDSCLRSWDIDSIISQIPKGQLESKKNSQKLKKLKLKTAVEDHGFYSGLTWAGGNNSGEPAEKKAKGEDDDDSDDGDGSDNNDDSESDED